MKWYLVSVYLIAVTLGVFIDVSGCLMCFAHLLLDYHFH